MPRVATSRVAHPDPLSDDRADPVLSAERVGLRYVSDRQPGLRRIRRGKTFAYRDSQGRAVHDATTLERIRGLVIPPAWTDVWICASPEGHIQATGRDLKGRKQYRYHPRFREARDETKYGKIFAFAAALPKIRARCQRSLRAKGLSYDKVLATVVLLLDQTLIRVGNEEYCRLNQSFGLTTLRDGHAHIRGSLLAFRFRGKSGKQHEVTLSDRRLAAIVRRCRDLPGDELFQYVGEDGSRRCVGSADVNAYLRAIAGEDFTAKDFRTLAGTVLAASALAECGPARTTTAAKRSVVAAIKRAAERLGNTPAVCRRCYVHPGILEAYARGRVVPRVASGATGPSTGLRADERTVLLFLRRHLAEVQEERAADGLKASLRRSIAKTAATQRNRTR